MNEVHNPVQVEAAIRDCANRIAAGVKVVSERYDAWKEAERAYDKAYAMAYLNATTPSGKAAPSHERRYHAELATADLRAALDVADSAYRYADRTAKAIESELRAWQSVGASVRAMYGVAGRGEF